jgi:hypothetical protein
MNNEEIIYEGNARVYLQGKGALQPIATKDIDCYTYFIGTETSSIQIKDYRTEVNQVAKAALEKRFNGEFADIFNEPARIEIFEAEGIIEIKMHPGQSDSTSPILWMGVIYDGKMPAHEITWESLKPIEGNAIAFAVLVDD